MPMLEKEAGPEGPAELIREAKRLGKSPGRCAQNQRSALPRLHQQHGCPELPSCCTAQSSPARPVWPVSPVASWSHSGRTSLVSASSGMDLLGAESAPQAGCVPCP